MRRSLIIGLFLLLGACATAVETRLAPPVSETGSSLKIESVKAKSIVAGVGPTILAKLENSVRSKLAQRSQGDLVANLELTVTRYMIVSGTTRFFAGAFAGSNEMFVSVKASAVDGKVLADFDVKRESNPGGYGTFYDQAGATIDATADGIVDALHGTIAQE